MTSSRILPAASTRWYTAYRCADAPRLRLLCFPYAGAPASAYRPWQLEVPPWCQVCAIQLPGRGTRMREPCIIDFGELVRVLSTELAPLMDAPVVFFGHSLGATLAFEMCRALRPHGTDVPRRLVVSGRRAPHIGDTSMLHDGSDSELVDYLRLQKGTPLEVLANRELLDMVVPVLRADLRLLHSYRFVDAERLGRSLSTEGRTTTRARTAGSRAGAGTPPPNVPCSCFPAAISSSSSAAFSLLSSQSSPVPSAGRHRSCQPLAARYRWRDGDRSAAVPDVPRCGDDGGRPSERARSDHLVPRGGTLHGARLPRRRRSHRFVRAHATSFSSRLSMRSTSLPRGVTVCPEPTPASARRLLVDPFYDSFQSNGLFFVPTAGPDAGVAMQFASAPCESELAGVCWTPDRQMLFLSVQHPGELHGTRTASMTRGSNGPSGRLGDPPRPGVVSIYRR